MEKVEATKEVPEEEKEADRCWKDLPLELLKGVSNISLSDRIRFRLTCKTWKSIVLPPRSIPLHLEFTSKQQQCPWLMFSRTGGNGDCNFYNPICNEKQPMHYPDLAGALISHSKYGWLLMTRGDSSIFFFHPFTRAVINLPDRPYGSDFRMMSFSSPPTSPDCVVFSTDITAGRSEIEIKCCYHGRNSWYTGYYDNNEPFKSSLCNPVFCNGVFYCLSEDGKLVAFDPRKKTWKVLPRPRGPRVPTFMNFIVKDDKDLILLCFGKVGNSVDVFKLDWNCMKWEKFENLGNRMIFVSRTTSLLVPAVTKGTENKIYLAKFHKQGEGNVFYSLSTAKYSIFDKEYSGENWYGTLEYTNCTWVDLDNNIIDSMISPCSDDGLNWLSNAPEDDSDDETEGDDDSEDDVVDV